MDFIRFEKEGYLMREDNQTPQATFEAGVRRVWYEEEWYYAIVDVVEALTDSPDPSSYWRNLKKQRLSKEENAAEVLDAIVQLKLQARDNRLRFTDTCNRQTVLRIIQSIPSPRAEPLKLWLAQVGDERIEEIEHPEQAIERVRQTYRAKGYDDAWIEERIKNDLVRNELTDEWKFRGAKEGQEFAILTNTIHEGTFEYSVQHHKKHKLLPAKANLRDHMTPLELILTSLSEATAITLHQDRDSQGLSSLKQDATDAGRAGRKAREAIEEEIKRPVVSSQNYLENTKRKQQKRIERTSQPSLFDEGSNESGDKP